MPVTVCCSMISPSSQMSVPGGLSCGSMASGWSKLERTKIRTLCTVPSSTERTCMTLAPSEASSSISSNAILSSSLRARDHARVAGIDAVDIGVDVAAVGADGGGNGHRRGIRSAAPQGGDAAGLLVHALETGDDRHFPAFLEAPDQFVAVDIEDLRRAVRVRSQDRKLPALPGTRIDIEVLEHDGEQTGRHLFARRHHGIVFPRIENAPLFQRRFAPPHELVGDARHGRDHDGDLMAGGDLAPDVTRHVADAVDVGDRRSAELHDETGHDDRCALSR